MKSVTPFLWFESRASEAVDFYVDVFGDAERKTTIAKAGEEPMGFTVRVKNLEFTVFNGGPAFKLDEACSLMVVAEDQDEVDRLWDALTADGGEESMCGWLKDKFGVSWQIVPEGFMECTFGPDPDGAKRAWDAMMTMRKLDLAAIQAAYAGE